MTFLALLILGILWAAVLLPPLVQRVPTIGSSRPARGSTSDFSQQLARLERPVAGAIGAGDRGGPQGFDFSEERLLPTSPLAAARRRRDVLGSLIALALFTLVATTMFGRIALYAHIVVDVVALAFGALMIRRNQLATERESVVAHLPTRTADDPVVVQLSDARQYRKSG